MTLNRNGIDNHTIFGRLAEFLHRHDVDIALIQEVTKGDGLTVKGYQSSVNVGTLGRGTAKLHKLHLKIYRLKRIPTGRGSAVYLDNICLVNIYAPSGNANKPERETISKQPSRHHLPRSRERQENCRISKIVDENGEDPPVQLGKRTKTKLKTGREDLATSTRNRSRTRLKNIYNCSQ